MHEECARLDERAAGVGVDPGHDEGAVARLHELVRPLLRHSEEGELAGGNIHPSESEPAVGERPARGKGRGFAGDLGQDGIEQPGPGERCPGEIRGSERGAGEVGPGEVGAG